MKLNFGVKNLRSIDIETPIELRPITILLGRNNVGKSTFLRAFPLLRQSTLKKQIGPLYWKGEVDFGDYDTAVNQSLQSEEMIFHFGCENLSISKKEFFRHTEYGKIYSGEMIDEVKQANLQVLLKGSDGNAVRKRTELSLPEFDIKVVFNFPVSGTYENVLINNQQLPKNFTNFSFEFTHNELLPFIRTSFESDVANVSGLRDVLATNISTFIDKAIKTETLDEISIEDSLFEVTKILGYPRFDSKRILSLANSIKSKSVQPFYDKIKDNQDLITELDTLCSLHTALFAYDKIAEVFGGVIENSTYIGPSRAKSKRYHELTNLDISELRVDGENLPEMLGSLNNEMLAKFSNWIEGIFNFGIHVEKRNGHISIFAKKENSLVNFADSGFGISQLIPVALQIWWDLNLLGDYSSLSTPTKNGVANNEHDIIKVLSVEQPELHLHPAHQSALADIFANSVKSAKDLNNRVKPAYFIETHSEALVNRLGALVEEGVVASEEIQVLMFTKDSDELTSPTTVKTIEYNEEGYLEEWPYGFFRIKNVS